MIKIKTSMALSASALETAMQTFKDEFKFMPEYKFVVKVSIELIFVAMELKDYFAEKWPVHFTCDRKLPIRDWELVGFKDGVKYSIYSEVS